MKHQYTITGRLIDKSGSLRDRQVQFNDVYNTEIERRQLVTVLPYSHTVEITVKKCYDYLSGKVLAEQYLDAFMGNREYIIL